MSLSRFIPDADLVHPDWLALLPEVLRPNSPPTRIWWRLHERAIARAWSIQRLDEQIVHGPWRSLGAATPALLQQVTRAVSHSVRPEGVSLSVSQERVARVLPAPAVRELERRVEANAPAVFLLLCAGAASRACFDVLKLRFEPAVSQEMVPQCDAIFSVADLRHGERMTAAVLAGYGPYGIHPAAEAMVAS